jgi:ribonuclease VapC
VIIDSSALIAILSEEPDAEQCVRAPRAALRRRMSAADLFETAIIIDRRSSPVASRRFDDFIREAAISIEPVDEAQAALARTAYRDFGQGSGHPARLNLGGCFADALARRHGEPLLFKGNDFIHTDITSALA